MVTVKKFVNKSGKEISYLEIENEKYPIKVGFKKAKAILEHGEEIKFVLEQMGLEVK